MVHQADEEIICIESITAVSLFSLSAVRQPEDARLQAAFVLYASHFFDDSEPML